MSDKCVECGSDDSWTLKSPYSKVCACGARKQLNFQTDQWELPPEK